MDMAKIRIFDEPFLYAFLFSLIICFYSKNQKVMAKC